MQLIITDAWLAKSHAIQLSGTKLVLAALLAALTLILLAAGVYQKVRNMMVPTQPPVVSATVGSAFG